MKKITIELEDNSIFGDIFTIALIGGIGTNTVSVTHGCFDLSKGTHFTLDDNTAKFTQQGEANNG